MPTKTKFTKKQLEQLYKGYAVNVKGGFYFINEYGDIDFMYSDTPVYKKIDFQGEYNE
jgi:hypothetical protein